MHEHYRHFHTSLTPTFLYLLKTYSITFIINPISGTGQKDAILERIMSLQHRSKGAGDKTSEEFKDETNDYPVTWDAVNVRMTEYAGHAAVIAAEEAALGTSVVVAVGGDGTVNEVARSLVHTETALGIIPCGSGNGLARHLRIPMDLDGAFRLLDEFHIASIDYGTINETPFFCTCGVGFDAFISQKFAEAGKRGLATYVEKTLTDGIHYRPQTYHVEIDGETNTFDAFLIACANASQYGNNAYIAPEASTRDGLLDVTILTPFTPLEAPQIIMQMFNRTLSRNPHVRTFRTPHLRILRDNDGPAHIDGDPVTMGEALEVSIHPLSLKVVGNGHPGHRPLSFPTIRAIENGLETIQQDLQRGIGDIQRGVDTLQRGIDDAQRSFQHEMYRLFFKNFNDIRHRFDHGKEGKNNNNKLL